MTDPQFNSIPKMTRYDYLTYLSLPLIGFMLAGFGFALLVGVANYLKS